MVLIVPSIKQYYYGKISFWFVYFVFLSEILGTIDFVLTDGTVVFRTCDAEKQHVVFQMVCGLQLRILSLNKLINVLLYLFLSWYYSEPNCGWSLCAVPAFFSSKTLYAMSITGIRFSLSCYVGYSRSRKSSESCQTCVSTCNSY